MFLFDLGAWFDFTVGYDLNDNHIPVGPIRFSRFRKETFKTIYFCRFAEEYQKPIQTLLTNISINVNIATFHLDLIKKQIKSNKCFDKLT